MSLPPPPPKKGNAKLAALSVPVVKDKAPAKPITSREDSSLVPLNFKVSPEFKRRFKMYAIENDATMVDLMVKTLSQLMDEN